MSQKMLITKLVRRGDRTDLIAQAHRYKDLTLFDLSLVGIDYNDLAEGVETPCRFWAHYTLSDKLNGSGNPYKDVASLEPFTAPTADPDPDTLTAILHELRAIRALLTVHVDNHTPQDEPPASQLAAVIQDALPQSVF